MIAVWFGHVTVGLIGRIAVAIAPAAAKARKCGIGNSGSSNARAGNPSIVTTMTIGVLALGACASKEPAATAKHIGTTPERIQVNFKEMASLKTTRPVYPSLLNRR